jgi:hypothetical protein
MAALKETIIHQDSCAFGPGATLQFVKHIGSLLLVFLVIASFSSVHAQTTNITHLLFPSSVVAGSLEPLPVSVTVPYNDTKPGFWLVVGIVDLKSNRTIVPGSAEGSPSPCLNQPSAQALCQVQLQSASGVENLQFKIGGIFANARHAPGTWDLQMTAEILDTNLIVLSRSNVSFTIKLAPISLIVDVPNNATIWVDGTASSGGNIAVAIGPHSISVPILVTINDTERLRFDSWADGFTQPNRTLFVSSNMRLRVVYHPQYRLSINNSFPGVNVVGAGWYDNGSLASFSVPETQLSGGGVFDFLGAKVTFQGWFENGNLITINSSGTIDMNSPHTIIAQWTTDYTIPIVLIAVVVAVCIGICLALRRPTRKSTKVPKRRVEGNRSKVKNRSRKS